MNFHFPLPARAGSLAIGTLLALVLLHESSPKAALRASSAKELSAADSEHTNDSKMHDTSALLVRNATNVSPADPGRPP